MAEAHDLIVIGGNAGGLSAAVFARRSGLERVTVLERGATLALPGVAVDVEIEPLVYRWSFGDGTTEDTTSLGQRFPAESDIRHVYEQSSLAAGGAYVVTVEVTFLARYGVNGGEGEALEPITRPFSNDYPVQQLQSVLVGQP